MSLDYYGYAPLLRLQRPLALCGLPGTERGSTARVVSMFSGVPVVRVEDQVAHLAGCHWDLLVLRDGAEAALALETQVIDRALSGRSAPVIGLSSITLQDAELRARLLAHSTVVHLQLSLSDSLARVQAQSLADPRRHAALRAGEPPTAGLLLPKLRFLERLCRAAHRAHPVGSAGAHEVGRALLETLEEAAGHQGRG